jgi:MOSC domain-containing protein YiiM
MHAAFTIEAVLTGRIAAFGPKREPSAIAKTRVAGRLRVGWLGLDGDQQGDLSVHGGPDKAIHHYPRDHYAWWQAQLPDHALLGDAGAFGENISTSGLAEDAACIGDRYRLGTALVEIAQGRQPCWKQAHRLSELRAVAMIVESGRSGWYYRVIEEGQVAAGDALTLLDRPLPDWSVARVTGMLIARRGRDPAALRELASLTALADGWRAKAERLQK